MRSIGKVKIKKLRQIVKFELTVQPDATVEDIMVAVPEGWFDLWEGAYTEIQNIIFDERLDISVKK